SSAHRGYRPHECPTVGMEHGKAPQVSVSGRHMEVNQGAHYIHIGVAMSNHYAFGPGGCSAGVINGGEVALFDLGPDKFGGGRRRESGLVVQPGFARAVEGNKMFDLRYLATNGI